MRYWRTLNSILTRAMSSATILLASGAVALAQHEQQAADAPAGPVDKSGWMLGYALVLLAIALGLIAVCRPGSRTNEIKIEEE